MYEGKLVRLRALEWDDAERYRSWVNDAELASLVDRFRPVSLEEHRRWYERVTTSESTLMFAVDDRESGEFLGCVWLQGIDRHHRKAEVRILLGAPSQLGKGRGTDALTTLRRVAFDRTGLSKLYAEVLETNERACRAFEAAGFRREGLLLDDRFVDGESRSVVRFGLLKRELQA